MYKRQLVDFAEFIFLCQCGTSHAGEFLVQPEQILEGDGSQGFGFLFHRHMFFGFDSLVQAFIVAASNRCV